MSARARILVAADASPASLAAAEAAIRLAVRLRREVLGLFVEDLDLLHATALPFTREIDSVSGADRAIVVEEVERKLRRQAAQAEAGLAAVAARHRVQWSFRVVRGRVTRELASATGTAALVSAGRGNRRALGGTARQLLLDAAHPVLLMAPGVALEGPVAVLDDPGAEAAIRDAAALLRRLDEEPFLLLSGPDPEHRRRELAERLPDFGLHPRFVDRSPSDPRALRSTLDRIGAKLLVVPAGRLGDPELFALLDQIDRPVLRLATPDLVRRPLADDRSDA